MATRKKAKAVETAEPVPNAAPVSGFVIKPRYREFVCEWFELDEGEEPFKATIRSNLSFAEVNALPLLQGSLYKDIWEVLTPHVVGWNLLAPDAESGEMVPVPPPSEAGSEVFQSTDPALTQWMFMTLKMAHQGGLTEIVSQKKE